MDGVANDLAKRHIPHIAPRRDDLAGPAGRLGDQVAIIIMCRRASRRLPMPWLYASLITAHASCAPLEVASNHTSMPHLHRRLAVARQLSLVIKHALRAQVSGWFVMTTADMRRIAQPWLRFSEDVRLDPEVRQ